AGDDPGRAAALRVRGDREAEVDALLARAHHAPRPRRVRAVVDAHVVLLPDVVRITVALLDVVRVVAPLGLRLGRVVEAHALVGGVPRLPAVCGLDDPRGRDGDEHPVRVARVDHDGVDAGGELSLRGRGAEPLGLALALAGEQVAAAGLVVP